MPTVAHAPKSRPDPKPMRFLLGVGGAAAFSALAAGIVLPPNTAVTSQANAPQSQQAAPAAAAPAAPVAVQQPIQYIQLQAGQTAPPGAKVIDPAAPQPTTIVTKVAAPPVQAPVIIKTTQSGKVIP